MDSSSVINTPQASPVSLDSLSLKEQDSAILREQIKQQFIQSWQLYQSLFDCLTESAYFAQANPLRHPLIFYYGHTAVFYINKLMAVGLLKTSVNPKLESLLAVGVDEMSWDDVNIPLQRWPTLAQVQTYRQQVYQIVLDLIEQSNLPAPIHWSHPWWAFLMGIEHERIHLETSSVLIRQLPLKYLIPQPNWQPQIQLAKAPNNQLIEVPGGQTQLGRGIPTKDHSLNFYYGWDNEYGLQTQIVKPFKASQYLVSNQEFLEFVKADGYTTQDYWTPEGWQWRQFHQDIMPSFWRLNPSGEYQLRCLFTEIAMPWSWPVIVNYHEAKAFCHWKTQTQGLTIDLPNEMQWQRLRDSISTDMNYWQTAKANIQLRYGANEMPVNQFKFNSFYDVIGNVWQWNSSTFNALPGFRAHPIYADFSTPTFDDQHQLIKGGSWISTGNETGYYARYAFRRHFYQHAGFRYINN